MEWQTLIRPRVLIVEDELPQLRGLERDIREIEAYKEDLGIDEFVINLAESVEEAEGFFPGPGGEPFDLLILDLGLPERKGEKEDAEHGQKLLERVWREGIAKEIIVVSIWWKADQVARAFRSGAVDFVNKMHLTSNVLQAKVIECWRRVLGKESARLLGAERIAELVPYAEKGLAHRFSTCFAGLVRAVTHGAEDIEAYVHERYGLDHRKDSQDYFFQWLEGQQRSLAEAKREWLDLQASLLPSDESYRKVTADLLLRDVHRSLSPCFIVKNVALEQSGGSETPVLTFEDDVRAVMKEIVAGALNERPDYEAQEQSIAVNVGDEKGQIRVSFADFLPAISPEAAERINRGSMLDPRLRFTREWGLSVVQHVAMRGGGRIEVEPRPSEGNVVTYHIPSAN